MEQDQNPQNTTEYMLGRIEAKVDTLLAGHLKTEERLDEQDGRISALERGRSYLLGAGAAVAAVVSTLGAVFFHG